MIPLDFKCFSCFIQKFRKEHFMKWLADIIASKAPNNKIYWKTNLTLYFIKYDIKH